MIDQHDQLEASIKKAVHQAAEEIQMDQSIQDKFLKVTKEPPLSPIQSFLEKEIEVPLLPFTAVLAGLVIICGLMVLAGIPLQQEPWPRYELNQYSSFAGQIITQHNPLQTDLKRK